MLTDTTSCTLFLILTSTLIDAQTIICIWGSTEEYGYGDYDRYNGEYIKQATLHNGLPYWKQTPGNPLCNANYHSAKIYASSYSGGKYWQVSEALSTNWVPREPSCESVNLANPTLCANNWFAFPDDTTSDGDGPLSLSVTGSQCPTLDCGRIQITGSGDSQCNKIFTKDFSLNYMWTSASSMRYLYFDFYTFKWYCSDVDGHTYCGVDDWIQHQAWCSASDQWKSANVGESFTLLVTTGNWAKFSCLDTLNPTDNPTAAPTHPTDLPTRSPTKDPTLNPTFTPTNAPTTSPSNAPSYRPSIAPSTSPTTAPSNAPSYPPSIAPTSHPSNAPSGAPTEAPTSPPTNAPSNSPIKTPTNPPTNAPSNTPSNNPSVAPTMPPTDAPSNAPSDHPSVAPTNSPTNAPSIAPSDHPSIAPSSPPTNTPSDAPTHAPSNPPSNAPSNSPTKTPTNPPTNAPSNAPTHPPTKAPSASPTNAPSNTPSDSPSVAPTSPPTNVPSYAPSDTPSVAPTTPPTDAPSDAPSHSPSATPTNPPTNAPTNAPSYNPSIAPTTPPTNAPTNAPSDNPSMAPSASPTEAPTQVPTIPSLHPTRHPTVEPTMPTNDPTESPSIHIDIATGNAAMFSDINVILTIVIVSAVVVLLASLAGCRWYIMRNRKGHTISQDTKSNDLSKTDGTNSNKMGEANTVETEMVEYMAGKEARQVLHIIPQYIGGFEEKERVNYDAPSENSHRKVVMVASVDEDSNSSSSDGLFGTMPIQKTPLGEAIGGDNGNVANGAPEGDEGNNGNNMLTPGGDDDNGMGMCVDCQQYKQGKRYDIDGMFYCEECYMEYEVVSAAAFLD